jgi:hypothetical protein
MRRDLRPFKPVAGVSGLSMERALNRRAAWKIPRITGRLGGNAGEKVRGR